MIKYKINHKDMSDTVYLFNWFIKDIYIYIHDKETIVFTHNIIMIKKKQDYIKKSKRFVLLVD